MSIANELMEQGKTDLLPARMLNEFVYCPRLYYLEYVQGEFEDSHDTVEGRHEHHRVDVPSSQAGDEGFSRITSLMLSSEKAGLIAKMDLVEGDGKGVMPVDYKHGSKPDQPDGMWLADKVQLCAQAIVLRDNGFECERGAIYYKGSRERVYLEISDELVQFTIEQVRGARDAAMGNIPEPLSDSPKCPRCSLVGICLPDETKSLEIVQGTGDQDEKIRRLYPARDDAMPAYVSEQGAIVSKRGEELIVKKEGLAIGSIRMMELSHLSVLGNAQVTTQTIHELCERNIPICYFSTGGWFYGTTLGMSHKNVHLRMKQYNTASDQERSLAIAKCFIGGKVKNCRTMLRRNCGNTSSAALEVLTEILDAIDGAKNAGELLGIEGTASRIYFMHFKSMLKSPNSTFDMNSRNRRPPRDPVNALLSFTYSLLSKDATIALMSVGFDPHMGFFHRPKYGKPSLALDLMEEFRPIIADSVVLGLINNQEVGEDVFVRAGGSVTMTDRARKTTIKAYERRMDTLIRHPLFNYTVSYRRILEVQSRLLSRHIMGELSTYPPFCTR